MPRRNSVMEPLEHRTLLSASPFSTAVAADRLQVRIDLLKFRIDCLTTTQTLQTDLAHIRADTKPADAASIKPLVVKFHSDVAAMRTQLLADRLAEASNVLADESKIVGELRQMLIDKANPTALAADKVVLKTDRIQMQTDMIAGLTARLTTRQNAFNTISADCAAIVTAVQSDTGSSTKLIADVTKFATDRTTTLTKLQGDLQQLITDRTQLAADLTASLSA